MRAKRLANTISLARYTGVEYPQTAFMSIIVDKFAHLRAILAQKHVQIGLIVFLIALLSFGVGYLFGRDFTKTPIVIEKVDSQ